MRLYQLNGKFRGDLVILLLSVGFKVGYSFSINSKNVWFVRCDCEELTFLRKICTILYIISKKKNYHNISVVIGRLVQGIAEKEEGALSHNCDFDKM